MPPRNNNLVFFKDYTTSHLRIRFNVHKLFTYYIIESGRGLAKPVYNYAARGYGLHDKRARYDH